MTTQINAGAAPNCEWQTLYRIGGIAAFVAAMFFRRNLAEEYLLFRGLGVIRSGPNAFPDIPADWFALLHTHPLLGLTFLNLFDAVNYVLVGLIFAGLYAALRQTDRGLMTLAMALAVGAIAVYFATNQAFAMLSLSHQYTTAVSDAQRAALLAAGQALLAIHNTGANYGPGLYVSFLLINTAGLIIAAVMLRSAVFSRFTALMGILANLFALGYYLTLTLDPRLRAIPLSAAAPFLLVWYLLLGRRLLGLAWPRRAEGSDKQPFLCGFSAP